MKATRSSATSFIQYSRRSLNSNSHIAFNQTIALRKSTLDVELNGFKITAVEEDD